MHRMRLTLIILMAGLTATVAVAGVQVGDKAPDFTLTDQNGQRVALSDFAGKVVVLEWTNPECPFVKRHYKQGTMKRLAAEYAKQDVVWLTINSTHFMSQDDNAAFAKANGLTVPVLLDADGTVGRLYGAKTTPHMFVIDAKGAIEYEGAIDDDPRGTKDSATNYVAAALDAVTKGKKPATAETKSYGCSVKYKG